MKTESIVLLSKPGQIIDFVMDLWDPSGPIARNHRDGGIIHDIVERFARLPRIFFEASEQRLEWTHFSPWWGAIQLADYENPTIRDLRYLHEIYHSATMPHARGMNLATMAARNAQNEREASTMSEMAIYLAVPDLRERSFPHTIFMDRFLYANPEMRTGRNERLIERWNRQPEVVFQELLYARLGVVLADDSEVDPNDPQTVWLRRYPEQNDLWIRSFSARHHLVDDAMVTLRERCEEIGPVEAGKRHLEWLLSDEISEGTGIPFRREAVEFRETFDRLIEDYDNAMTAADERPVRSIGG